MAANPITVHARFEPSWNPAANDVAIRIVLGTPAGKNLLMDPEHVLAKDEAGKLLGGDWIGGVIMPGGGSDPWLMWLTCST